MHGWLVHCGYCQANITCKTSSNPDLIQNYFLSTEIFSSLDIHSEQMSQCASHSCLRNVFLDALASLGSMLESESVSH